jgi:hypothetical protein
VLDTISNWHFQAGIHHSASLFNLVVLIRVGIRHKVKFADDIAHDPQQLKPQQLQQLKKCFLCTTLDKLRLKQSLLLDWEFVPGKGLVEIQDPAPVQGLYGDQGVPLSNVIKNYTFSVRDKIILAHTVAQTFWQLYASDFMQSVWTSDNIWFMYHENEGTRGNKLPMKVYIAFDFSKDPQTVPEFLAKHPGDNLSHRLPHVLALGILILEIALGDTVREPGSIAMDITTLHIQAHKKYTRLKDTQWDGFKLHMDHLIEAIHQCLEFKVWLDSCPPTPDLETPIATGKNDGKLGSKLNQKEPTNLLNRKELLYDKVVKPLACLASAFHEDIEKVTYPYNDVTYILPCNEKARIIKRFQPKSALPFSKQASTWFDDLKVINAYLQDQIEARQEENETEIAKDHSSVDKARSKCFSPIKVAILDTGYNPDMGFFKTEGRSSRIKWKDFVCEAPRGVDDHGHGSFMTQLVMATSPFVDVYVVRIAESEKDIDYSGDERIGKVCGGSVVEG